MTASKKTTIMDLPDEMLDKVLNHVPVRHRLSIVSGVCRKFQALAGIEVRIDFRDTKQLAKTWITLMTTKPTVRYLNIDIYNYKLFTCETVLEEEEGINYNMNLRYMERILAYSARSLKSLTLDGVRTQARCDVWLKFFQLLRFYRFPILETIDGSRVRICDLSHLEEIYRVVYCLEIKPEPDRGTTEDWIPDLPSTSALGKFLLGCPRLRTLKLGKMLVFEEELRMALTSAHPKTLTRLEIEPMSWVLTVAGMSTARDVWSGMQRFKNLTCLKVPYTNDVAEWALRDLDSSNLKCLTLTVDPAVEPTNCSVIEWPFTKHVKRLELRFLKERAGKFICNNTKQMLLKFSSLEEIKFHNLFYNLNDDESERAELLKMIVDNGIQAEAKFDEVARRRRSRDASRTILLLLLYLGLLIFTLSLPFMHPAFLRRPSGFSSS